LHTTAIPDATTARKEIHINNEQKSANACATTIGDKIRVTSEKKPIPLLSPLQSKLGCFLLSATGSSYSGTTLHGGGDGEKALFSAFLGWRNVKDAL